MTQSFMLLLTNGSTLLKPFCDSNTVLNGSEKPTPSLFSISRLFVLTLDNINLTSYMDQAPVYATESNVQGLKVI